MKTGDEQVLRVFVLSRTQAGERFVKLTLVDASQGIVTALMRAASKPGTAVAADLFDEAEVTLSAPRDGGARFVAEYRVLRRRTALGSDYERLEKACRFASVLAHNPLPPESAEWIFALCGLALDAFAGRPRPDATLFKSLWQLARNEGLPVREHWFAGLPEAGRRATESVLRHPLDSQEIAATEVQQLCRQMEQWLIGECHFVIP